jgi:hypothetical protein
VSINKLRKQDKRTILIGLLVAVIFVAIGTFLFSYAMETLDVAAEELGATTQIVINAPLPDYVVPGFEDNIIVNLMLGIASTLLIFGVTYGVGKLLPKRNISSASQ